MVTGPVNRFVRGVLRHQSLSELVTKKVQGKIARLVDSIYKPTMDIRAYTACAPPPHLKCFLLAEDDAKSVDLSSAMFRMHREIAGSWTEYMHTDEVLHHKALTWANKYELTSHGICPFCKRGQEPPDTML